MQRVSIGRAIVREPRVFLMDEPLSNLDAKLRELLRAELKDLQMKLGATFLYVTHDQVEAMSMGDKVGVLNQGRIVQVGTPQQIYNRPHDTFVATFVGSPAMNLLPAAVRVGGWWCARQAGDPGGRRCCSAGAVRRRTGSRWACAPKTSLLGEGRGLEGQVYAVENHGVEKVVTLKVDEHAAEGHGAGPHGRRGRQHGSVYIQSRKSCSSSTPQTGVNLYYGKEEVEHG